MLADPTTIEQVVVNLVTNARDAIDRHGTITIRTRTESDEVVLAVEDTGEGMAPAVQERVFEPFFTTKAPGQGTGLGLPMVHGLIRQHEGTVEVDSEPGRGTRVTVRLPLRLDRVDCADPSPTPASGRGETILVVEDNRSVSAAASHCLQRAGFIVLTASDGVEALATLAEHPGIDLVLSDVIMPRMGGVELRERIEERHPSVPIGLTSGYSPDLADEERLLLKPWTPDELTAFVRRCLDERSGRPG